MCLSLMAINFICQTSLTQNRYQRMDKCSILEGWRGQASDTCCKEKGSEPTLNVPKTLKAFVPFRFSAINPWLKGSLFQTVFCPSS